MNKRSISILYFLYFLFAYIGVVYVDSNPPIIKIVSPQNLSLVGESVNIILNVTDDFGLDKCWIDYNNMTIQFNCNNITINLVNQTNYIYIYAKDISGNINKNLLILYKDTEPPKIISYGFYPGNNTLLSDNYFFWINVTDNYGIKYVIFSVNGNERRLEYNSTFYNISTKLYSSNNLIKWVVCDFSNLCSEISFLYKVILPESLGIYLDIFPQEVYLNEKVRILYSIEQFDEGNLTIVLPNNERIFYKLNKSGEIVFDNTYLLGKYDILVIARKGNYISTKNTSFYVKRYAEISVVPLEKTSIFLSISKNNTKIIEKELEKEENVLLKEGNYDIFIEAFNKTLKVLFKDAQVEEKHEVLLSKFSGNLTTIYFIKPLFWYRYVTLRLSYSEVANTSDPKLLNYIDVYKCEEYDTEKNLCNSEWIPIKFTVDLANREIIYSSSTLSAFKISLKNNTCLFNVEYPLYLKVINNTISFNITINNIQCYLPYQIKLLDVESYDVSTNNFYLNPKESITLNLTGKNPKTYYVRLSINNEIYTIFLISEKIYYVNDVLIHPKEVYKVINKNETSKQCITFINFGDRKRIIINSSFIQDMFSLDKNEMIDKCFVIYKNEIGRFEDTIYITIENFTVKIPVTIDVIPRGEFDLRIDIPNKIKLGERLIGGVLIMFKGDVKDIIVCYKILDSKDNLIKQNCTNREVEMKINYYNIVTLKINETVEKEGRYRFDIYSQAGNNFIYGFKEFYVEKEKTFFVSKYTLYILIIFAIIILILKYYKKL